MIRIIEPQKIAFISSFRPRKCGIATFASDLIENIGKAGGIEFRPSVVAMQSECEHKYIKPVEFTIRKDITADYIDAADQLNSTNVEIVSLQHEFGLFGGEGGSHISLLLNRLEAPVVTTLHTILEKPSPEYFEVLIDVCDKSETIIVMNERGIQMLIDIYGVPKRKIKLIPHGIPDIPFSHKNLHKQSLGLSKRKIILTFGLIGRNKGIEVMLRAMPAIIKKHPDILYIVLGMTHPEVVKHEGYSYKNELLNLVKDLNIQNHIIFYDKFVSDPVLQRFLSASEIYVTPYLYKEQLTSGTLAFAVGAGKAVVSTPYWAAEELLAEGRGKLVPFGNSEQMALAIIELLDDDSILNQMQLRAYEYGRKILWSKIGETYWNLFTGKSSNIFGTPDLKTNLRDPNVIQSKPVINKTIREMNPTFLMD
jgi:glycosyltransferase involved in cell wall biosynthesis